MVAIIEEPEDHDDADGNATEGEDKENPHEEGDGDEDEARVSSSADDSEAAAERAAAKKEKEKKVCVMISDVSGWKIEIWPQQIATLNKIRGLAAARLRVPVREVNLQLNDELLTEERSKPLLPFEGQDVHFTWFREPRLAVLLKRKGLRDLNSVGKYGRNVLHYAALDRDYDMMRETLSRRGFKHYLANEPDVFFDTPLMLSGIRGDEDIMQLLMERHASIHCCNVYGRTPIMVAAEHGHSKVVIHLLESKGSLSPDPKSTVGRNVPNALHLAILNGQEGCAMSITSYIERQRLQKKQEAEAKEAERTKKILIEKQFDEEQAAREEALTAPLDR